MSTATVKRYLSQARYLDMRIDSKVQQVASLNDLAAKCTTTLTGMPRDPNHGKYSMEDVIAKIVDMQAEINREIDALVDLKKEITDIIKSVADQECQTILEKRYLCFLSWEQIAVDMGYDLRWLYRLHGKALEAAEILTPAETDH